MHVYDGKGQWVIKTSYDLVPGDIIAIAPGYQHKKSVFESVTDAEYLSQAIPFGGKMPNKVLNSTGDKNKEENSSFRNVSCDIILLSGSCIANESILTG